MLDAAPGGRDITNGVAGALIGALGGHPILSTAPLIPLSPLWAKGGRSVAPLQRAVAHATRLCDAARAADAL